MIEGGWDQYSDKELASYLSSSSPTPARIRDQLASGELVLLKEIPAAPVFRLVSGRIVPTESTSTYKDRVPVAHAELVGENFEVVVDDDFTLVWYPDDSGHRPVVSTEYPADSGIDPYSILVTPIQEDGQEHSPPGYQRPFEDQVELIVRFPADSGIEPLYLVFRKTARDERGVVTGNGEEITGTWLESASRDLGAPIPAQIADRLRGREFASFDRFREAFWLEVSGDHTLLSQFRGSNQELIKQGYAPFPREALNKSPKSAIIRPSSIA
jgi:hypothetical protein